jgi:hypothetical protein
MRVGLFEDVMKEEKKLSVGPSVRSGSGVLGRVGK